jgi:hypothetical protein
MPGNTCPICHKPVMKYCRFLSEPFYKISSCVSCGSQLRRSHGIWFSYPVIMVVVLICTFLLIPKLIDANLSYWTGVAIGLAFLVGVTLLEYYILWRVISWVAVEPTTYTRKPPNP